MGLLDDRLKLNKDMTQLRGSIECEEGKKADCPTRQWMTVYQI